MLPAIPPKYFLPLIGLAVSAFVFNTSEFMPIALLTDISASFGKTPAETGIMITAYAWVVGVLSLPLMLAVTRMQPRRLLLAVLALFAAGQIGSGLATSFAMLMVARVAVACAHAIFWSITAPFATRLVTREHQPFALSCVATGSAIAMIFGLPIGRLIGLALGWRKTFFCIAAVTLAAFLYLWRVFPQLSEGGAPFETRDLPALVRDPLVFGIFFLAVTFATGYFTIYSYIEPYLGTVAGFSPDAITATLMALGVFGFLGSVLFSRLYGTHRRFCLLFGSVGIVVCALLYVPAAALAPVLALVCLALGTISTLFNITMQAELLAATSRAAAPVATSIYSGLFNVGIGSGTALGSYVASVGHLPTIGLAGAAIAALAAVYCICRYLPYLKKAHDD